MISVDGVTELPRRAAWVWGPEPLHKECRPALVTPYDGLADYKLTRHHVRADYAQDAMGAVALLDQIREEVAPRRAMTAQRVDPLDEDQQL